MDPLYHAFNLFLLCGVVPWLRVGLRVWKGLGLWSWNLFLMKLSWKFSSWTEPRGFCRVRGIRAEVRKEEEDPVECDPDSGFKGEKVLQDFHKPRGLISRIKIWPRPHSPSYVSVGASPSRMPFSNSSKVHIEQCSPHIRGFPTFFLVVQASHVPWKGSRDSELKFLSKAPLIYFLLISKAWTVRKPSE